MKKKVDNNNGGAPDRRNLKAEIMKVLEEYPIDDTRPSKDRTIKLYGAKMTEYIAIHRALRELQESGSFSQFETNRETYISIYERIPAKEVFFI